MDNKQPLLPLLEVINLSLAIKQDDQWVAITHKVSFSLNKGESLGLVGESGCGKSLTAQAILRLLPQPNIKVITGDILFHGKSLLTLNSAKLNAVRGNKIAMIFQEPMTALNPVLTIGSQIYEQIKIHNTGLTKSQIRQATIALLDDVGIDFSNERYKSYPHQLSGGMRQRVMIAMALSCKPELIIADEPTTALDVSLQAQILSLLDKLKKKYNTSLLFISHDLAVVAQVCKKAMIMYAGEIIEQGEVEDLFNHPQHPYSKALLLCSPSQQQDPRTKLPSIPNSQKSDETAQQRIERFEKILNNFNYQQHQPQLQPSMSATDVILRITKLNKYYALPKPLLSIRQRAVHAVKDISLTLHKGQTLGIVGTSGSGKSTLAKMMCAIEKPNSGTIELFNSPLSSYSRKTLATNIQYIFQDPQESLNSRHTVEQLLIEPLIIHNIESPAQRYSLVKETLKLVGLDESCLTKYPHEFSGGQKQRIGIARALILKPKLLICDEPVSALDVSVQAQILNLLIDIQDKLKLSMIFITHDLYVVRHMANNIAVMHEGAIVEYGSAKHICDSPQESYTQQLIAATPTWPIANNALA